MKKMLSLFVAIAIIGSMLCVSAYAAPMDVNSYNYNMSVDYSSLSTEDLTGYTSVKSLTTHSSDYSVSSDSGVDVLKWTTKEFKATNENSKLNIPLDKPFYANEGAFVLEFRTKLPKESTYRQLVNGFMNFETESSKSNAGSSALKFGLGQATGNGFQPVINGSVYALLNDIGWGDDNKLLYSNYGDKYVTYKFVVDPDTKTFRFYVKPDGSSWSEPYADKSFKNPYTTTDTTDTFEKGLMPTGELPTEPIVALSLTSTYINNESVEAGTSDAALEKNYYVSDISIQQEPKNIMAYSLDYSKANTSDTPNETYQNLWGSATHSVKYIKDTSLKQNILQWTVKDTTDQGAPMRLKVPLGVMSIDTTKGPFSIIMNAKLPSQDVLSTRTMSGFPNLVGGTNEIGMGLMSYDQVGWGNGLACGNYGTGKNSNQGWFYTNSTQEINGTKYLNNGLGSGDNITNANRSHYSLGTGIYDKYCLYKFDVNPDKMTFRFFYSKDNGVEWEEPYKDVEFLKVGAASADDKLAAGELPLSNEGGKLPAVIDELRFTILDYGVNDAANAAANKAKVSDFRIASIKIIQGRSVVGSCSATKDESNSVSVKFTNYFENNKGLVVALYGYNNNLKDVMINPTNGEGTFANATYTSGDYVKYFIFDDLTNIYPLCEAKQVDIK